jgi:hypothetical protein
VGLLWVIQRHLHSPAPSALFRACEAVHAEVLYEDFDDAQLPQLSTDRPTIFFGSCRFAQLIAAANAWRPGVWFDPESFCCSRYLSEFGSLMLNHDGEVTTLATLPHSPLWQQAKVFLRSDGDLKELDGSVWDRSQLHAFVERLVTRGEQQMLALPILVAPRKLIDYEWRLFILDGLVLSASQYRYFGDVCCQPGAPDRVVDFAERVAAIWSPARLYVMDVAQCDTGLFVLELNGFNSCGFYSCDVPHIVREVQRVLVA